MRNEAAALILAALALFGGGVWLTGYAIDRDIPANTNPAKEARK